MEDEQGRIRTYDYTVIVDELEMGAFSCESYGLKICERGSDACCAICHITTSRSRLEELCELVLFCGVTPVTLTDVVADWL